MKNNSEIKEIYNSLCKMQEAKNKAYGESALKPLDIFAKHHPYGSRLDEKLARVKNCDELRKNDVADIMGGIVLLNKSFMENCNLENIYNIMYELRQSVFEWKLPNGTSEDIFNGRSDINLLLQIIKEAKKEALNVFMLTDLFNRLALICKEKGWNNFNDQID